MSFVHLHLHTTFSFGDGACRINEVVMRAAELGMPALAVTDHEGLYGAVRFYQACKAAGIKPIVGVELTVEPAVGPGGRVWEPGADGAADAAVRPARATPPADPGERARRTGAATPAAAAALAPDGRIAHLKAAATVPPAAARASGAGGYHLVLLAKDYAGWSNLCRIISAAHLEHPGEPPLARLATLAEHGGHLVALSGCRRGEVWSRLLAGDKAGARAAASVFHGIFGRDYFIELQHELLPDSDTSLRALDLLAHELRIPTVATGDVHYTVKADAGLHDVLAAEAANQPLPNPLGRKNAELYLKGPGQMRRLFQRYPEAYANAGRIAARCNLDLGLGRLLFPAYPLPPGETAFSLLWKRCFEGAAERYRPLTAEVTARLERELKVVEELGFAEYFLAVRDIVEFALRPRHLLLRPRLRRQQHRQLRAAHHRRRPHRQRAALRALPQPVPPRHAGRGHRLLLGAPRRGHPVHLRALRPRQGRHGGHRQHRARAVGGAHRQPRVRVHAGRDQRLSRVPWGSAAKLGEMLAERPELADHEFQQPHYRRLVDVAERLSGFPAHLGTHLGGFILSRDPLTDRVPLQWAAKGVVVAQFDKDDVETLGLVKMDILALKMHSAIAEAVRRIEARTGERVSAWELPRDDPKVYELIRSARTVGLFQLESSGQRNLATRLQERDFEDVIAAISLFRPGPLQADMIAPFIRRRHGKEPVVVPHPAMERVLRRTYGVIVYQEQVIEVASAVAGFSLAEADLLRRTMTHERSMEEMDAIGRDFVEKAMALGASREVADEVFRQLRGFAAYGFNKAHAACFAIVCNASAWLKAHYPAEFYAGILNNQPMGFYSPRVVLNDARRFGLAVLPLDVNLSGEWFEVERDGTALRVGLAYVKEMSAAARRAIVEARGDTTDPYTSLADFIARTRVSREITENLARLGAFDALGVRREELIAQMPLLYAGARSAPASLPPRPAADGLDQPRLALDEQLGPLGFLPDWSAQRRVAVELELLGLNVSAHPLRFVRDEIKALGVTPMARLPELASRPPRARGRRARARPDALDPQRPPHHVPHARGRDRARPGGGLQRRLPQVRAGAQGRGVPAGRGRAAERRGARPRGGGAPHQRPAAGHRPRRQGGRGPGGRQRRTG